MHAVPEVGGGAAAQTGGEAGGHRPSIGESLLPLPLQCWLLPLLPQWQHRRAKSLVRRLAMSSSYVSSALSKYRQFVLSLSLQNILYLWVVSTKMTNTARFVFNNNPNPITQQSIQ